MNLDKTVQLIEKKKQIIPGGNTFNKTSFFDQGLTPFALSSAKGAYVTDVDGNEYIDYIQGLGCVNLGYCFDVVDEAIREQLKNGISFSLMNPLEVEVAEKLINLIHGAEMVRFGKNGSDVLSAAVKLSRFITKKDHILYSGYHGWHDWVISNSSKPGGIPETVRELSHKFVFNDIVSLKDRIKEFDNNVACVVMDLVARQYPEPDFLEEVRDLTRENNIVLIFDEVITGFRVHKGGAQTFFNVTPDLSCFGKAMANGMPLAALVGRKDYMEQLDDIFFSLTFAGETLSLAAANATIDFYNEVDVIGEIVKKGEILKQGFETIIVEAGLEDMLEISGMPQRPIINIKNQCVEIEADADEIIKVIIQEFSKRNILTNSSFFVSYSHTKDDIEQTLNIFKSVCEVLKNLIK